jgi:hypothetical protein
MMGNWAYLIYPVVGYVALCTVCYVAGYMVTSGSMAAARRAYEKDAKKRTPQLEEEADG